MEHWLDDDYHANCVDVCSCSSCPYNLGERGGKIYCDYYEDFVSDCACGGMHNTVIIDV